MYTHLPIPYVIDGKDLREFHKNIVISCYENKIKLKIETRNILTTPRTLIFKATLYTISQDTETA